MRGLIVLRELISRRALVRAAIGLIAAATSVSRAADHPASSQISSASPTFGLWYTVWWTADDQFGHWSRCHRLPKRGKYTSGDPAVIADHYRQFRNLGVDFLIMDDTNSVGNDGGRINDNIRAWFDFMDARPASQRIPICIGGGGEMRGGGRPAQSGAADFYAENWARRPSYFQMNGKPLLLVDTDDNYGPGAWDDPRFTVRWAYNGDNHESIGRRQTWGWGSYHPAPILAECMSIWPGHRFPQNVVKLGNDPLEEAREGGRTYVQAWLRVLKAHPQYVTVADWNNFEEDTAIEDSFGWEDARGFAAPSLYRRITRAYSRLRSGQLVKGEYYRDEQQPEVYLFDGKKLVHQPDMPARTAVIHVPAGLLERIRRRLEASAASRAGA
jgi:hypothetical protein